MIWLILYFLLILLVLFIFSLELKRNYGKNNRIVNKIPGPKSLPILGNIELFLDPVSLFYKKNQWTAKYYPIYKVWATGVIYSIQLMAPEDIQIVLSNPVHNRKSVIYDTFHEWLGTGLLTSHSDKWQNRRKILTPTFHFNILKRFIGIFNRHAIELVEDFKNDDAKDIDIIRHLSKSALFTITETAMGINLNNSTSEKRYRDAVCRMGANITYRILRPWLNFGLLRYLTYQFYEERFLLKYLKSFTKNVIAQRKKKFQDGNITSAPTGPDEDDNCIGKKRNQLAMLDLLLSAKTRGEITDEGILEEVDTFMFGGLDSVSISLQYTLMLIANHSDVQEKLYEEVMAIFEHREPTYEDLNALTYMDMVIKESLRLYPIVPYISRIAGEDFVTLSGHTIPAGSTLFLTIFDTHRLKHIYPEPEKFIPERFNVENSKDRHPYAFLAFSAGSRNCIGRKYAMLNMKCKLAAIVKNFVLLPISKPEDIILPIAIVLRSKDKIKVEFKRRY